VLLRCIVPWGCKLWCLVVEICKARACDAMVGVGASHAGVVHLHRSKLGTLGLEQYPALFDKHMSVGFGAQGYTCKKVDVWGPTF
jgi:hypothetical protein